MDEAEMRRTLQVLRQELRENETAHENLVVVIRGLEAQLRLVQVAALGELAKRG